MREGERRGSRRIESEGRKRELKMRKKRRVKVGWKVEDRRIGSRWTCGADPVTGHHIESLTLAEYYF